MYPRLKVICILIASMLLIQGCENLATKKASEMVRPDARPVKNITGFTDSLMCMDDLFLSFGVNNVVVTSQGIPDATGEIKTGTKEMMISAISKMSNKSSAFVFVDFDQTQFDINALQKLVGFTNEFVVPNYYIRGAITQFDESIKSENLGGGFSSSILSLGASIDETVSMVSVDLNMGNLLTRQILTGTTANNSIAIRRSGKSADAGGSGSIKNNELGLNFNISLNRSEGMHQSIRTLLELSLIESLGKLSKVPYWRCLGMGQTDPKIMTQARSAFMSMSESEQITFVQRTLIAQGLYEGDDDGVMSQALKEAVGSYQGNHGLLADGRIDFDLYAALISVDLATGRIRPKKKVTQPLADKLKVEPPKEKLSINVSAGKDSPSSYKLGDRLSFTLEPSIDAFAYCYYQDAENRIARVFPNRFQPNALLSKGSRVKIPGTEAKFEILLEAGATDHEEILCIASNIELGIELPEFLKTTDLSPLQVSSLNDIAQSFRDLARKGQLVEQRLSIKVTQ